MPFSAIPKIVKLDQNLIAIQKRWQDEKNRALQDELFAKEFAPQFAPLFAELPLFGAPENFCRPTYLISVLGLSWQPVALMAAWIKPKQMLILGTKESFEQPYESGESPLAKIARISGIPLERIKREEISDPCEVDIYKRIREFIASRQLDPKLVAIDPTGGKKSMSASAALAGFMLGTPLVYVDYLHYHYRIPLAGTEYPRLLTNPLEEFGDLETEKIANAFNRGDFSEAEHRANDLAQRLYEPRPVEARYHVARAYGAWDRFDFQGALAAMHDALKILEKFRRVGQWDWAEKIHPMIIKHSELLRTVCSMPEKPESLEQGFPLVLNHLAAAQRKLEEGRFSLAVLLAYATMERYVDLYLWVKHHLDDENPEYEKILHDFNEKRYEEGGQRWFGKIYEKRPLNGPLMFANGILLLYALSPQHIMLDDLGALKGLAHIRNKCEFEHGIYAKPIDYNLANKHIQTVVKILARIRSGTEELLIELEAFKFPKIT